MKNTLLTLSFNYSRLTVLALFWFASIPAWALDSNLPPGRNFDLTHWYLTLPEEGAPQISPIALSSGYSNASWFYTGPDGAMCFWSPVTGGTTLNSSYPRSELRELIYPPDYNANWKVQGTHILTARCRVTQIPSSGKVIIGQIHSYTGNAYPLLKLQYANGLIDALVKKSPTDNSDIHYPFSNVPLGDTIAYEIGMVDGLLTITVNGSRQSVNLAQTSPAWTNETMYFKAGAYCQDNSGPSSEGARVMFTALSVVHSNLVQNPPVIRSLPPGANVTTGAMVSFKVITSGTPPFSYQWRFDGTNLVDTSTITGVNAASLTISNVQPAQAGYYTLRVSNAVGTTVSSNILLRVNGAAGPVIDLALALDTLNWNWVANGGLWLGQSSVTYDGVDAAQSATIPDDKTTSLQTTVAGPGTVSFAWKVSSETNKDYFKFYVGSSEMARISGEIDWQTRSFSIGPGSKMLKWSYSKSSSTVKGQDHGWLDQVTYFPLPAPNTPGYVSATPVSSTRMSVSWSDLSTNETGFIVERSLDGTNFSRIGLVGANVTSFVSAGLLPETAYFYRVSATNMAGMSPHSTYGMGTTLEFLGAKINFQPASAPVPAGYNVDAGEAFGNRGSNELSYGWNVSNTSNTKDRNSSSSLDQRYDTFIYSQKSSATRWEMAVPNGLYNVFLVAGDPSKINSIYSYTVEGVLALNGTPTSSHHWISGMATVHVADGRLTITNGPGASNNRICFIEITRRGSLLSCSGSKTVELGYLWDFDSPTETIDGCSGGHVLIRATSTVTNWTGFCGGGFSATRTWSATDRCGNSDSCSQTVTVVDTTPPMIIGPSDKRVVCGSDWSFDEPTGVEDAGGGTNVILAIVGTTIDRSGFCDGSYQAIRTWSATDLCGNSNTCNQIVTVMDPQGPPFICQTNKTVECGFPWNFDDPLLTTYSCSGWAGALAIVSTETNQTGTCAGTFAVTRIWSVVEPCGSNYVCRQTVTIQDTTPPVLLCADIHSLDPNVNALPHAADDCDPAPTLSCTRSDNLPMSAPFPIGSTVVTCEAVDCSGNSVTCVFTVTVEDGPT